MSPLDTVRGSVGGRVFQILTEQVSQIWVAKVSEIEGERGIKLSADGRTRAEFMSSDKNGAVTSAQKFLIARFGEVDRRFDEAPAVPEAEGELRTAGNPSTA